MSTIPQIKDQLVTKVDQFVQNVGYTEPQDITKVPESGGDQDWMDSWRLLFARLRVRRITPSFQASVFWL